jgi:hypothetical protein
MRLSELDCSLNQAASRRSPGVASMGAAFEARIAEIRKTKALSTSLLANCKRPFVERLRVTGSGRSETDDDGLRSTLDGR